MAESKLGQELKKALELQQFELYYQPKLDLTSGKITGVEALLRWKHPETGVISPLEFIPLAEDTGLILPIGEWVLRTACEQNKLWHEMGFSSMVMAVNVSGRQLDEPDFVQCVARILQETRLSPEYLEIEITENMMMDVHRVLPVLNDLKHIGVRISLDDFGTGYSSLYYLNKFPIDIIKVDQSFVRNCTVDTKEETIVKAIIAMAHQLKVEIVAEGIETKDHLVFLQRNLCNKGQGYFFSKPLPAVVLEQRFDELEQIVSKYGVSMEVSRQTWLENELESARQELRDTVRQQQGMIIKFIERDGKFVHTMCDGELVYRIGLTPEQILGEELTDFRSVCDAERKLEYYRRAWSGEDHVTYEAQSNGVWYLVSLRPIRKGGQVVEVIGSCVDITERVKKEQEVSRLAERLAEQERQYRILADNTDDFIVLFNRNRIIEYVSPSYKRLLGVSLDGRVGEPGLNQVHPDDVALVIKRFDNVIESKRSMSVECRSLTADGSYIWIEFVEHPILWPDGEVGHVLFVGRNITERKVQEDKLRQSENRYRALVELSPDAIFVHMGGRILYANKSSVELLAETSVNDLIGRSLFDFIHPKDLEKTRNRIEHGMSAEGNTCGLTEARFIRFDGIEIDIEFTSVGILYGDENAIQLLVRDITARKKTERLLTEEKEKLESVLKNAEDAINIVNLDGNILRVNPAWETRYGWTEEEVVGRPDPTVSHDRFNHGWKHLVEQILRGGTIPNYEISVCGKSGNEFCVSTSIYPINNADGKVVAVVGSTRDITERKEAERKLRESEEKYRLIAENMQDLIGLLDAEGVVQYASPSHETVLGLPPQLYEGKSAFKLVHPDDRADVEKQFAHMISSQTYSHVEFRYQHANGHWVPLEAKGAPVLNDKGEVAHWVVAARDISKRKQVEAVVRKSEKLALAGQLAAGVVHEIRNPLTVVQGFAQLLQQEGNEPFYVNIMLSEISRMNDVVTELLTLAKSQAVKRKEINPASLLDQVLSIMNTQAILHNIEIRHKYSLNLPFIECDENQIKQVFVNILQNAIEAMTSGGTIHVEISLPTSHSIQFRFIDEGFGISDERMKHLGEPFYGSNEKGTGSRLMVSHKIIQEHRGMIHINSVVNKGTTVDIVLPTMKQAEESTDIDLFHY